MPKPDIKAVTKEFREERDKKEAAEGKMAKLRKQFFDLIKIPAPMLARQTIYYEGDDYRSYVASLYPKWTILAAEELSGEWRLVLEEDPAKKTYMFVNPDDEYVYTRTVAESAPDVDFERLAQERPTLFKRITFQPKPPRELKELDKINDRDKEILKQYLKAPKLTHRMEKPRKATEEELEGNG